MGNNDLLFFLSYLIFLIINACLGFFVEKKITKELDANFSGDISDETLEESNLYYIMKYFFNLFIIGIIWLTGPIGTIILIYKMIKKDN